MADLIVGASRIEMARIDRAKIRAAMQREWIGDPTETSLGGIELRVNANVPEGVAVVMDRRGNILRILDLRGDHDPSKAPTSHPGARE